MLAAISKNNGSQELRKTLRMVGPISGRARLSTACSAAGLICLEGHLLLDEAARFPETTLRNTGAGFLGLWLGECNYVVLGKDMRVEMVDASNYTHASHAVAAFLSSPFGFFWQGLMQH